ncbi:MAG: putative membrane protein [Candidatus Endobugula sp.]|jgi:uncharacterized membrane protein
MLTTDNKLNAILLATYAAYIALVALMAYTFAINEAHSWKLLVFQCLPLALVLPGLIKMHFRAHSWLCFVILVYFMAYVVEVGSPIGEITDWIGLALSVVIFSGAMMSSRYLQRL